MTEEKDYFDSSNLIVFLYKYKKTIAIITISAAIISGIISLLIPNKFQSTVVVYPSNTNSIAKALINSGMGNQSDIMEFGEEEKTEQMLEVLNSELVKQAIISEFNLLKHFRIDSNKTKTPYTDLIKEYNKNINFQRNINMAIEIEVLDENSDTASLIANRIVAVADDVMNSIQKERTRQGFEIVQRRFNEKVHEIKVLEDSLENIMKLGVLDISSQTEVYSDAHAQAISSGNQSAVKALQTKIDILSSYGSQFMSLNENLENERMKLSDLKAKYDEAKIDAEERIQNFFIVTKAFPAEKKTYPIRWLIVTLSTFGSLLMGILSLIVFEQMQKVKYQIENNK